MFKFVTIYRRVDDEEALERFFSGTHMSLAEQLPGLRKTEVSRIRGKPGGQSRFHLMYELYFDTHEDYVRALSSPPGIKLMIALKPWDEARVVSWFFADAYADVQPTAPADRPASPQTEQPE